MKLTLTKNFLPNYDNAINLTNKIQILNAKNPSPYTFYGTNSYIIGQESVMILDPGPNLETHFENLKKTVNNRRVSHILLTHHHHDHSDLALRASAYFGAPIAKAPLKINKMRNNQQNSDEKIIAHDLAIDISLQDNMIIANDEVSLLAIATPGHSSDHMVFSFESENILFSGDHVMAWATSVIIPPDGSLKDYMSSLEKLSTRTDNYYLPAHGGAVANPQQFVRGLRNHRKIRERAIIERLHKGDTTIAEIVHNIYHDVNQNLKNAAALSVWAHLIDLYERNLITCQTMPTLDGIYSSL